MDLRFPGHENVKIVDGVPEGWRKELVGDVIKKVPKTKQIKTSEYLKEGSIPVIDQSRNYIAGYTNDKESLINADIPVIVFGDHTRIIKYINFPFAKGADGTQLIISKINELPQSLLYCALVEIDLSNYHYARHFKYLKSEEIFVPSLKVAENFDKCCSVLFTQILNKRKYVIYLQEARDRLLPKLMSGEIEV